MSGDTFSLLSIPVYRQEKKTKQEDFRACHQVVHPEQMICLKCLHCGKTWLDRKCIISQVSFPPSCISDQSLTSKRRCNLVLMFSLLPVCCNIFSSSDFIKYSTSVCSFLKQASLFHRSMYMATEGCNYYVTYSGCECASRKSPNPPKCPRYLLLPQKCICSESTNQGSQSLFINIPVEKLLKEGISVPKSACLNINQHSELHRKKNQVHL